MKDEDGWIWLTPEQKGEMKPADWNPDGEEVCGEEKC